MNNDINKYKPESDFEKEEYSGLINKLVNLEKEKVSEEFETKFADALKRATFTVFTKETLLNRLDLFFALRPVKVVTFSAAIVIILLLFLSLPIKDYKMPEKIMTQNYSIKSDSIQKTMIQKGNTKDQPLFNSNQLNDKSANDVANFSYVHKLIKDLETTYGLTLQEKDAPEKIINEIMKGKYFQQSLESRKNLLRSDTLKILFNIIKQKGIDTK